MVHRVIQWSTGNVGAHAVRAVAERPDLRLVGAYTYGGPKVGRDVGEILGIGKVGAKATDDVERLVRMPADVVLHTPLPSLVYGDEPGLDLDVICRLLASGKNVITVVGYMYPKVHGRAVVRRLEEACRAGGTSFHGTGLNPGWMGELMPLTMSALSRRIEQITVTEITEFSRYPSPEIMFDAMGFGSTPTAFRRDGARRREWLNGLFRENIALMADGLGVKLDRITDELEIVAADEAFDTAAGEIGAGTVAGQRWRWTGRIGRRAALVHETVWRMGPHIAPDWPTGDHSIHIDGEPEMHLTFGRRWCTDGLMATAMHAVNAIDAVVNAPVGIRTFLDLPPIFGRGAFRQ